MSIAPSEAAAVLRPATLDDAQMVWHCRQALRGSAAIQSSSKDEGYETHVSWFSRAVTDPRRLFLIIEKDAKSLGYLRFDPLDTASGHRVSIALLPNARGTGVGGTALMLGCAQAERAGFAPLLADINVSNHASRGIFEKCGFVPLGSDVSPDCFLRFIRYPLSVPASALAVQNRKEPSSMTSIEIDGRRIGPDQPPYVIAEISANHNGDIATALRLIGIAKDAGASAVKIQTYRPDTITIDCDSELFQVKGGIWDGRTLYDLYGEAFTPWEWHETLFAEARKLGITMFSSPFDNTAVDLLEELGAPAYKVASFEAVDLPLIKYIASKRKPMIISTGMANDEEISEAVAAAREGGCTQLALLHCVSGYPAPAQDYNLRTIPDMIERFGTIVGLSDHTLDNTTAVTSVALGASILEKHFTLDRKGGGPDDSFSLEPEGLKQLCDSARTSWDSLGHVDYGRKSSEQGNIVFRRSLFVVEDIPAGGEFTINNIRSIRPGYGLAPKHLDTVLGRRAGIALTRGEPLSWAHIEPS